VKDGQTAHVLRSPLDGGAHLVPVGHVDLIGAAPELAGDLGALIAVTVEQRDLRPLLRHTTGRRRAHP